MIATDTVIMAIKTKPGLTELLKKRSRNMKYEGIMMVIENKTS
jgi:hypothetical protein